MDGGNVSVCCNGPVENDFYADEDEIIPLQIRTHKLNRISGLVAV